uniref:Sororin C-terminal region domain-containing protein n=1 Tax=Mola mola TaxID=94237 RepID=A0A3Q3X740_MOLML
MSEKKHTGFKVLKRRRLFFPPHSQHVRASYHFSFCRAERFSGCTLQTVPCLQLLQHIAAKSSHLPQVSTPGSVPERGRSSSAKKKAVMPSPILPSSPTHSGPQQPAVEPGDAEWSQKVRRSYSKLSDKSSNSPDARETLFGFDQLKTPEVVRGAKPSKTRLELSGSLSALNSFTFLLEENNCGSALLEQDANIPGLAVVREKRRRRRVRQIDDAELDAMAAQMNAEFEEAEVFELVVE